MRNFLVLRPRNDSVINEVCEKKMKEIKIGNKIINASGPCFIVAEMSANHGGDFNKALALMKAAKQSGADAVKLQTYRAETMTLDSPKEDFQISSDSPWGNFRNLFALYEKASTPWEWHEGLIAEGKKIGMEVFSSPFDGSAVDFLEDLNIPAYKIASPEITDIPLLKRVAATHKPVIVSTGLATEEDICLAVDTLRKHGCKDIVLLKCTTAYPTPPEEVNLMTIPDMMRKFDCLTGISDHTLGIGIPISAVSLGARLIEKHFILNKEEDSVDAFFSMDPREFKLMVDEVRKTEKALGRVEYNLTETAKKNLKIRRSLYVAEDIKKGEEFTLTNVKSVRSAYGLHPKNLDLVLGKKAKIDMEKGDRLSWDVIASEPR